MCVCMWSVMFADVYMYTISVGVYMNIGVGIYTEVRMFIILFHVLHYGGKVFNW